MKKAILTGLSALCVAAAASTPALAADMYRPPEGVSLKDAPAAYAIWPGFYAGINGGYGWQDGTGAIWYNDAFMPLKLVTTSSPGLSPQGPFGGVQAGYNFLRDSLVYGIEADFQGAGIGASSNSQGTSVNGPINIAAKTATDWFGTVRGRLGWTAGNTLLYATGGLAYGNVRPDFTLSGTGDPISDSLVLKKDAIRVGYAAGGGVEHSLSPAWSFKAEYQFIDLGSDTLSGVSVKGVPFTTSELETNYHTVRLGLNYHPGQVYEPLK